MSHEETTESILELEASNLFDARAAGLLVVDVQQKLWPQIDGRADVLRRVLQAIDVAGNLELPILVTEQYSKGLGPTIPEVRAALERWDAYRPVEKQAFSCLGEPELTPLVEEAGITTLALAGIESHVCVMQTALDALDSGIDPFYIAEATGSRDPRHKIEAIDRVRDAGAIVGSVEMFAFEAMRTAAHPRFREVQKIIV
ncbi:MAG: isochorismatase family protein [Polyangia bacterium]